MSTKEWARKANERALRERILRDLEPHIKYIRKVGHSLTAQNIERIVRGEVV